MSSILEEVIRKTGDKFVEYTNTYKTSVSYKEESRHAYKIIQADQRLSKAFSDDPASLGRALEYVAMVGLTLSPIFKYAYLTSRYNSKTKTNFLQLFISYKGKIKLAIESGVVKRVVAEVVKQGDVFKFVGAHSYPVHEYQLTDDRNTAKTIGAYAVAHFEDGSLLTITLSEGEIKKIKAQSTAKYEGNPWEVWGDEMTKKSALNRLDKLLPETKNSRREMAMMISGESEEDEATTEKQAVSQSNSQSAVQSLLSENSSINANVGQQ